jgi:hypothetical protein
MCCALKKKKKRFLFSKTGRRSLSQPTAEAGLACPARSPAPAPALRPWLPRGGRTPATPAGWRPVAPAPLQARLHPPRARPSPLLPLISSYRAAVAAHAHAFASATVRRRITRRRRAPPLRRYFPIHLARSSASPSSFSCSRHHHCFRQGKAQLSSFSTAAPWPRVAGAPPLFLSSL